MVKDIFIISLCVFIICLPLIAITYWVDKTQCKSKAEIQGFEWSYGAIQGCMVKIENKWTDYSRLRYMEE